MLQSFTFTATAGRNVIQAQGRRLLYQMSNAATLGIDSGVDISGDGQSFGIFYPGDKITLPREVRTWTFAPVSPLLVGTVKIGDGDVETAMLSGSVSVIDGQVDTVMKGLCYWGSALKAGVAAQYSAVGFFNASTNKVMAINTAKVTVSLATQIRVITGGRLVNQASEGGLRNKKLGDPASTYLRYEQGYSLNYPPTAPTDFTSAAGFHSVLLFEAKRETVLTFSNDGPLILGTGVGIYFVCNTASVDLCVETDVTELGTA
jgi:hypothetical protein